MIIGATTYAVKEKIDYQYLGISIKCPCLYIGFTFCIVAGVLAIVAGILYLIKKND